VCPGYRLASDRTFRNATKATPCGGSLVASNTPRSLLGLEPPLQKSDLFYEDANGKGEEIVCCDSKALQLTASGRPLLSDYVMKGSSDASGMELLSGSTNRNRAYEHSPTNFAQKCLKYPYLADAPSLPFRTLLLGNFFYHYTLPPTEFDPQGFMPFMPHLYAMAADNSCLKLAVEATALANAACQWRLHDQLARARFYYGQALAGLNAALRNAETAIVDATLCTLMVLTIYEVRQSKKVFHLHFQLTITQNITNCVMRPFGSHQDGYTSLLLLREASLVNTPSSACLSYHVASQLVSFALPHSSTYHEICSPRQQLASLRLRAHPRQELSRWLKTTGTMSPASNIRLYCHRANELCAAATDLLLEFAVDSVDASRLWTLMRDCEETDEQLQTWYELEGCEMEQRPLQSTTAQEHTDKLLQETLVECAHEYELHLISGTATTPSILAQKLIGFVNAIDRLITEIIASIPFILALVDAEGRPAPTGAGKGLSGLLLMWPLGIICKCPFASTEQKQCAVRALDYIGRSMGIKRALTLKHLWSGELTG
jgi:hypothetical protein